MKWAGGKSELLTQIWPHLPRTFARYHEPFLGGAALFFALRPTRARLSDINEEIVNAYVVLRDSPELLIRRLNEHRNERSYYNELRAKHPGSLDAVARASRTLYLNRTGFNGLYRVNKAGLFNVPFGRHKSPLVFDESNLTLCSHALQGQEIVTGSYADVSEFAEPGDLVYFDPPYVPISKTSAFTQYAQGGFSWADQERLAHLVHALTRRQVSVLLSNADVPELRTLYGRYNIVSLTARRRINSKVAKRGPIGEILVVAGPTLRT